MGNDSLDSFSNPTIEEYRKMVWIPLKKYQEELVKLRQELAEANKKLAYIQEKKNIQKRVYYEFHKDDKLLSAKGDKP